MNKITFRHLLGIETILSFILGIFFISLNLTGAVISNGTNSSIFGVVFFIFGLIGLFTIVKSKK